MLQVDVFILKKTVSYLLIIDFVKKNQHWELVLILYMWTESKSIFKKCFKILLH